MGYGFKVIVEGDFACFTRPEMKVERVSYEVPTPSALEGMLKSVYWKPAIRYVIDKIIVFNPVNFINIRRNEVSDKVLFSNVKSCVNGKYKDPSIVTSDCRNQRAAMLLKNVRYGVEFHFELTGLRCDNEADSESKHYNIIKRRLEKGQSFRTPCLGCSEFPVKRLELVDSFDYSEISPIISSLGDVGLGRMIYGIKFDDRGIPKNGDWQSPVFSDKAEAVYYSPHMVNGVIDVALYREGLNAY